MTQLTENMLMWVSYFVLVLTRMSALFVVSPVLGRKNVPNTAKIMLSVMMSFIIINLYPAPETLVFPTLLSYGVIVVLELLVGLVIGYVNTVFFATVNTAGQMIDTQIGFGMVQMFDPQSNMQVPIVGSLLNVVLVVTFIMSDGHMILIRFLFRTYEAIPVGQVVFNPDIFWVILEGFVTAFILSINIAIPVIASGLVAEIALGIIVRTSPQMNIFVVGIPIKVIIGLISIMLIIPIFEGMCGYIFDEMYNTIDRVFNMLRVV